MRIRVSVIALLATSCLASLGCSGAPEEIAELKKSNAALAADIAEIRKQQQDALNDPGRKILEARIAAAEKRLDDAAEPSTISTKELVCKTIKIIDDNGRVVGAIFGSNLGSTVSVRRVLADEAISVGKLHGSGGSFEVNGNGVALALRDPQGNIRATLGTVADGGGEVTGLDLIGAPGKGIELTTEGLTEIGGHTKVPAAAHARTKEFLANAIQAGYKRAILSGTLSNEDKVRLIGMVKYMTKQVEQGKDPKVSVDELARWPQESARILTAFFPEFLPE